jgi:hypothetical protein
VTLHFRDFIEMRKIATWRGQREEGIKLVTECEFNFQRV